MVAEGGESGAVPSEKGGLVAGGEAVEVGGEAADGGVGKKPLADEADAALAFGMDEGVVGGSEGVEAEGAAGEEDFTEQEGGIAVEEADATVTEMPFPPERISPLFTIAQPEMLRSPGEVVMTPLFFRSARM